MPKKKPAANTAQVPPSSTTLLRNKNLPVQLMEEMLPLVLSLEADHPQVSSQAESILAQYGHLFDQYRTSTDQSRGILDDLQMARREVYFTDVRVLRLQWLSVAAQGKCLYLSVLRAINKELATDAAADWLRLLSGCAALRRWHSLLTKFPLRAKPGPTELRELVCIFFRPWEYADRLHIMAIASFLDRSIAVECPAILNRAEYRYTYSELAHQQPDIVLLACRHDPDADPSNCLAEPYVISHYVPAAHDPTIWPSLELPPPFRPTPVSVVLDADGVEIERDVGLQFELDAGGTYAGSFVVRLPTMRVLTSACRCSLFSILLSALLDPPPLPTTTNTHTFPALFSTCCCMILTCWCLPMKCPYLLLFPPPCSLPSGSLPMF
jgi:hypothetical protein